MIAFIHVPEGVQKSGPVLVGLEHRSLLISTGGEVISSAGILYAKRAGHNGKTVARKEANVNGKDLPPRIPLDPRFHGHEELYRQHDLFYQPAKYRHPGCDC